jgi:hypothetical protein
MLPWNLPIGAHVILTAWMFCSGSLLRMLLFVLERLLVGGRSVFFFGIFSFFPHIFVLVNCVIPRPFSYALMLFGGIGGFVTFVSALCVCLSVLDMILINSTYKLVLLLHFELVDSPVERSLFFLRRVIMLPPASLLPFPRASLSLSQHPLLDRSPALAFPLGCALLLFLLLHRCFSFPRPASCL